MNPELFTFFILTCIISVSFALSLYYKKENNDEDNRPRYLPDLSSTILPFFLLAFFVFGSLTAAAGSPYRLFFPSVLQCFYILVCIILYCFPSSRFCESILVPGHAICYGSFQIISTLPGRVSCPCKNLLSS